MDKVLFKQVTILGLGLIGGSLGMALRQYCLAEQVVAWGRNIESLKKGESLGACDKFSTDLNEALAGADCVIVAAPVLATEKLMGKVIASVPSTTIVTDVASVKGNLVQVLSSAEGVLPDNVVLAHPIAGSEKSGVSAARADLFAQHILVITPPNKQFDEYHEKVAAMWCGCGAEVVTMSPEQHDTIFAATSHLPHVLAYALVYALQNSEEKDDVFRFAAGGFRDFSRIAASDPQMWTDIAIANKAELLDWLVQFQQVLNKLTVLLEREDSAAMKSMFVDAKSARDRFGKMLTARQQNSRDDSA